MQRALGVTTVVLVSVVVLQLVALRRMRVEIGQLRAEAGAYALEPRRDEIARTGRWLHTWLESRDGGSQPGGLCPGGEPDVLTIAQMLGTYLRDRAAGASEIEARQAIITRITETRRREPR